ncbi:DNA-3-methyladenine glycosylase family protein [Pedosphaera parvula]|uniref:DNA-(apurinic or apyrimidinic site) lyase n=1 Tax=Pedosphaera parvula (strain Ellin514) TaxID=320771 RepID=B9XGL2_PEDPL|nr:DNA glycosylase [Pedosphaera parvula]EEF61063.1 8-oxoguanine DNA glycosylase domain protein [Pedosphaera parvula Ellin514]
MRITEREIIIPATDYDLPGTLSSGQAFRWREEHNSWIGVIGNHWVRLRSSSNSIIAEVAEPVTDWSWLVDFLQTHLELKSVLATFPKDEPLGNAIRACHGLRLLRQNPWECLASFILSSTKQIVQIQQIVELLCIRFGEPVPVPPGHSPAYAFPSAMRLAAATEAELRDCKMGFRAPYLRETARMIHSGEVILERLYGMDVDDARAELLKLPGVGRKIADCVLLFAYGFQAAFPVDVWVMKALQHLYFPKRRPSRKRLEKFTQTYFGPNAGYAQQYLFHYMRTKQVSRRSDRP